MMIYRIFFVQQLQTFLLLIFLYLIIFIILGFQFVDPVENSKLNLYVATIILCLLAGFVGFIDYQLRKDNILIFIIQYAIINLFSILMTYSHRPYKVMIDQIYDQEKQEEINSQSESLKSMHLHH
jgi:uncharacterized membrane protein YGL010W